MAMSEKVKGRAAAAAADHIEPGEQVLQTLYATTGKTGFTVRGRVLILTDRQLLVFRTSFIGTAPKKFDQTVPRVGLTVDAWRQNISFKRLKLSGANGFKLSLMVPRVYAADGKAFAEQLQPSGV